MHCILKQGYTSCNLLKLCTNLIEGHNKLECLQICSSSDFNFNVLDSTAGPTLGHTLIKPFLLISSPASAYMLTRAQNKGHS